MMISFSDVYYTVVDTDDISGCRICDCRENVYPYQILLYLNQDYENPMTLEYELGDEQLRRDDYKYLIDYLTNRN